MIRCMNLDTLVSVDCSHYMFYSAAGESQATMLKEATVEPFLDV